MQKMIKLAFGLLLLTSTALCQPKKPVGQFSRAIVTDSLKLRGIWYKTLTGQNLATANLTATGNYNHNWKGNQLKIDSIGDFLLESKTNAGAMVLRKSYSQSGVSVINTLGISFSTKLTFLAAYDGAKNSVFQLDAGTSVWKSDSILLRLKNYTAQPVNSLMALTNPANGAMTWISPGTIVSSGGGATAGQFWATGGNSSPGTTNFTLGSLTADDVRFVTGSGGNEVIRLTKTGAVGIRQSSPNSSLDVHGSFGARFNTVNLGDGFFYTIASAGSDTTGALTYFVKPTESGQGFFQLPSAANAKDRIIIVKLQGGGASLAYTLTVQSTGGIDLVENRDGNLVSSVDMLSGYTHWYQSDGIQWWLIFAK